jgi:hypothetical protein
MSRNTNALTFVRMKKPTRTNRLCQKAGIMTGVFRSDQCSPNKNPEECAALNLRKTSGRNGVTILVLSNGGAGVNRMPSYGRIVQEANAAGKAGGYADVDAVT